MRIFVTGASGYIASAVIPELLSHGHEVVGLVRTEESSAPVTRLGAQVVQGDLADLDTLRDAASTADGVIHLAYDHGRMNSGKLDEAQSIDEAALRALSEPLAGTDKPLVGTSATLMLATDGIAARPGTEADSVAAGPRAASENFVVGLAGTGVRSSVVRVAPLVHSDQDRHAFTVNLIAFARERGAAAYVGDGANRWAAVNTYDLGALFRLAVERAPAGSRLHGVGDEGIAFRTIAETIAEQLDVPAVSVTPDEAPQYLDFLAGFAQLDGPVSSAATRELVGWQPTHPGWVDDVRAGHYFS